jgi:Zn-dependent protease with chaperone function
LDGQSAAVRTVLIYRKSADQQTLLLVDESDPSSTWKFDHFAARRISLGLWRLTSPSLPRAELMVDDPDFGLSLDSSHAKETGGNQRMLLLAMLVAVVCGAFGIFKLVDPVSRVLARKVPVSLEVKLRSSMIDLFAAKRCSEPVAQAVADRLLRDLRLPTDVIEPEVVIVRDPAVNAFALPGGLIILNSGFIEQSESGEEIAGVLAHEVEHLQQRHIAGKLMRSIMLTAAWQIAVGDYSGLLAVDPATLMDVAALKFDRQAETEADAGAIRRLTHARYSPAGLADFFRRNSENESGLLSFLSTHPASEERMAEIEKAQHSRQTIAAMNDDELMVLKKSCDDPGSQ